MEETHLSDLLAENKLTLARLNAQLQATLPVYIEEKATSPTIGANTSATLDVNAQRDTYFKVTSIYVSVPVGTTVAILQLGSDLFIPLQNTTTFLAPIEKILQPTDLRQLTFTTGSTAGTGFVWLLGEAIPKYGVL